MNDLTPQTEDNTPETNDRNLSAWLESSLGVEVSFRTENRFPDGKPATSELVGCSFRGMTPVKREAAVRRLEEAMTPADRRSLEEWVTALHAGTVRRREDGEGMVMTLDLYVGVLARYPGDVAKAACMKSMLEDQWFPPVAHLEALCKALAHKRTLMIERARAWAPQSSPRDPMRDEATELKTRASELERRIPMKYRMEVPRSQWTGDYLAWATQADGLIADAKRIERGRRG